MATTTSIAGVVPSTKSAEPATASRRLPGVSIIIPAYNEAGAVGEVVEHVSKVMRASGTDYEVVVVDDGSADLTAQVAEAAGALVLRHTANRGYGAALKTGIRRAKHPLICITDSDGTYPNEMIPTLLRVIVDEDLDMVVGARTGASVAIPWVRRPAKYALNALANVIAGTKIPDLNSGLRVFPRETALLLQNLLPDGFSFTTTITLAMLSNGYTIEFIPISYYKRVGRSKIRPIRDTLNFTQLILRMALYFAPLKIFLPLSGILFLLAGAWAVFTRIVFGTLADVSTIVLGAAALQVAMTGLLAELVNRRLPGYWKEPKAQG